MQAQQNATQTESPNGNNGVDSGALTPAQDYYITFCAANGLEVNEDGSMVKISSERFAQKLSVNRTTLWRWRSSIPDFEQHVRQRRREIFTANRENAIWHGLFLRAAKGDAKQAEMILSHFGDYAPPAQRHEVKVSGLTDLVKLARQKQTKVIDGTTTGATASGN